MQTTEQRPGCAGVMPRAPVSVDEILLVLAQKIPTDANGCDAEYWRRQLDDLDYFTTKTPQMERQELFTLTSHPCTGNSQAHEYLRFMIGQAIGSES